MLWCDCCRLPSLVPLQNFHMPRFTLDQHAYTRFYSADRAPTLLVQHDLKPAKLAFWNQRVPEMYVQQLAEMAQYPAPGTVLAPRDVTELQRVHSTSREEMGADDEGQQQGGREGEAERGR